MKKGISLKYQVEHKGKAMYTYFVEHCTHPQQRDTFFFSKMVKMFPKALQAHEANFHTLIQLTLTAFTFRTYRNRASKFACVPKISQSKDNTLKWHCKPKH